MSYTVAHIDPQLGGYFLIEGTPSAPNPRL